MEEPGNVALVTRTLVHNGSRAVEEPGTLDVPSFLDLCSLMESCVILDRLQAIDSADIMPSFSLAARLREEGLLTEFRPSLSAADMRRVLLRLPEALGQQLIGTEHGPDDEDDRPAEIIGESGSLLAMDYSGAIADLDARLQRIARMPSLPYSASTAERLQRSVLYLVTASAHGLDYFPDFDRAPFVQSILDKTYRSLPVQLYQRVAESLREPLGKGDLIAEWTLRAELPIPPVSALVLGRTRSLDELPDRLLEVRDEFAGFRRHFAAFKADLLATDTVAERRKMLLRVRQLLETASGPKPQLVSAQEMLNFAEKTVALAAAPQLPTSYSALLLTQPLDWIQRWWRRRPIAILFRLDSKVPRISEYGTLIERLWGTRISDRTLDQYAAHAADIGRLMATPAAR